MNRSTLRWVCTAWWLGACGGAIGDRAVAVAPAGEPAPDLSAPLSAIEVVGLSADRAAAARQLIASQVGAPLDRAQLRRDVRALWAMGGVADVVVRAVARGQGVALRFELAARPTLRAVAVDGVALGGKVFDPRAVFGAKIGQSFEPTAFGRGRGALLRAYQEAGFPFVEVAWTVEPAAAGSVDLRIKVTEGHPVAVAALEFRGNRQVETAELVAALARGTRTTTGQPYVRHAIRAGLVHLNALYYDRGHIEARVGPVEEVFDAARTKVELVIPVDEGPRFRLGAVRVRGALVAPERDYLRRFGMRRGQVFSRARVVAGMAALVALHKDRGSPEPRIDPTTEIDPKTKTVDLTLELAVPSGS